MIKTIQPNNFLTKRLPLLITTLMMAQLSHAQDSIRNIISLYQTETIKPISILIPSGIAIAGAIALNSAAIERLNMNIQEKVVPSDRTKKNHADDYLQYSPAILALGLNSFGIKGAHKLKHAAIIFGMSNIMLNAIVIPTKKISHELRPDSSGYSSFPSGHTAEAFASAEFLRMEYKDKSPWYGVAGYAMAFTTGYLRMYNNKHWFGDVVTGACIGIVSTKISYWIFSKIEQRKSQKRIIAVYNKGLI